MQFLRLSALAVCALPVLAGAQAPKGAPPGIITNYANDPALSSTNLEKLKVINSSGSRKTLIQVSMTKVPGVDKVGQWTCCLTAYDIDSAYGGALGGQYVVMGQYDETGATPTFTPNKFANAMNNTSNASIFGLMIEPRLGLIAMVDQRDGVYIGNRLAPVRPFNKPVKVVPASGAPALPGTYIDPAPGYVDGKLVFFYVNGGQTALEMRELTLTLSGGVISKAEAGKPTVVTQMGTRPHSPTPIVDLTGQVRGLWIAANSGSDSDMFFQPGLTTKDTPLKLFDNGNWMNNGGIIGGRLFFANNGTANNIQRAEVAWMVGSITKLGGTATMTIGVGNPKKASPVISTVVGMSARLPGIAAPVTIPGWNGQYGLASVDLQLARVVSLNKDQIGGWSAPVPNIASLAGLRLSVQGLAKVQATPLTFTNTATLEFK